jgi:tRNA(fMet)-specific endonuclease VapC
VPEALVDTDILSEVMKGRNEVVRSRATEYLSTYGSFSISSVTILEVVKGFQKARREPELQRFLSSLSSVRVFPFAQPEAVLAGKIYGDLERLGKPIGRADPMIAATAIIHGLVLVTGNEEHYQRVRDAGYELALNNWKRTTQSP